MAVMTGPSRPSTRASGVSVLCFFFFFVLLFALEPCLAFDPERRGIVTVNIICMIGRYA